MLTQIVSGGQTGADQAALDVAIDLGIDHGGWVPLGRLTESGVLDSKYHMQEMLTDEYSARTEQNVIDSHGTLILSHGPLTGGSKYTQKMADKHGRPWLHIDLARSSAFDAARKTSEWLTENRVSVLNVAGSRASKDPRIYQATRDVIENAYYLGLVNDSGVLDGPDVAPNEIQPLAPPATLMQAVAMLSRKLTLRDRHRIANMPTEALSELGLSLEVFLQSEFGLPDRNQALEGSVRVAAGEFGLQDAAASLVVARALWETLRGTHRLRVVK
ncbi:MAG: putative molybdenum carrier protein [Desulfobacterales bacterium]|nr:putative molybdenum carrier protein [Desulfobacterales bacterium]